VKRTSQHVKPRQLWGYLYLHTRSILSGTLWHAANGRLGFLMMDL
jgi:hypothetical protein